MMGWLLAFVMVMCMTGDDVSDVAPSSPSEAWTSSPKDKLIDSFGGMGISDTTVNVLERSGPHETSVLRSEGGSSL